MDYGERVRGKQLCSFQALPMILQLIPAMIGAGTSIAGMFNKDEGDSGGGGGGGGGAMGGGPSASSMQPAVSGTDYRNNENAYWQQLFAGTGQGLPQGQLPQSIQENIDKQAALLKG